MDRIILIETSTALCSVALAENGAVTAYRESSAPKAHASLTAVFVQEVLAERGVTLADCDAVCVSMGPGSYTGLRVGVSTAKGLCFGANKPLLAVGTLHTLAEAADLHKAGADGEPQTHSDQQDHQHIVGDIRVNVTYDGIQCVFNSLHDLFPPKSKRVAEYQQLRRSDAQEDSCVLCPFA